MRQSSAALLRLRCAITSALRGAGLLEPAWSRSGTPVHRLTDLGALLMAHGPRDGGPDGRQHGIPELYVELLRAHQYLPAVSPDLVAGGDWSGPGHSMRLGRIEDEAGEVAILRGTVQRLEAELSGIMGRHLEQLAELSAELGAAERRIGALTEALADERNIDRVLAGRKAGSAELREAAASALPGQIFIPGTIAPRDSAG